MQKALDDLKTKLMEEEIEKRKRDEKWVHDASVDYKNRVPLRSSTGAWKAALFVLGKRVKDLSFFT